MTTTLDIQERLKHLGFDPGRLDNDYGPRTREAIWAALKTLEPADAPPAPLPAPKDGKSPVWDQPKAPRDIREIIIHCAATPEGRPVTVDQIRSWHKARGWNDIGYHYVVLLDGTVAPGRPEAKIGAHVSGHNSGTLGICYVGGVEKDGLTPKDTRTAAQTAALLDTCRALLAKYPGISKISGHNQYAAKACPSFDVRNDPLGKLV
jgi:N-acetylmuramoyl-L-alanine amidase